MKEIINPTIKNDKIHDYPMMMIPKFPNPKFFVVIVYVGNVYGILFNKSIKNDTIF